MKYFITKYALSVGIEEIECQDTTDPRVKRGDKWNYFHNGDWHDTREVAIKRAEEMRCKKIASLKKSIAKLEKLKFA